MRAILMAAAVAVALTGSGAAAFEPTGELVFRPAGAMSATASFDAEQIVGPTVNVARDDAGTWSGDVAGQDVSLSIGASKISGVNVNLVLSTKGGSTSVEGLFYGRRVRIEIDEKKLHGRVGACSFDMKRRSPGVFDGDVGCMAANQSFPVTAKAAIVLSGEASRVPPPVPQFALGLLAILPG